MNYHIGSRDVGIGFRILPAFRPDIVNVLFDADVDCVEDTRRKWTRAADCETRVFGYCLSDRQGVQTLNVNFDAYTSSLIPFNPEYRNFYCYEEGQGVDYLFGESVGVMERRTVHTTALDIVVGQREFEDVPPDFLSVDTQGSERAILCGAAGVLREHVLGLLVEAELVPIYKDQPLLGDVQTLLEGAGFRLAGLTPHPECSPYRGPIGARAGGFLLSGDALFLREWDTLAAASGSVDERFLKLHKLAFISVMFGRLEYALQGLDLARALAPDPQLMRELETRAYFRFLGEMREAVAALPAVRPPTMGEVMTFEQAQARFRP